MDSCTMRSNVALCKQTSENNAAESYWPGLRLLRMKPLPTDAECCCFSIPLSYAMCYCHCASLQLSSVALCRLTSENTHAESCWPELRILACKDTMAFVQTEGHLGANFLKPGLGPVRNLKQYMPARVNTQGPDWRTAI